MKYDYLIVGSGFFGSTFARLATDKGLKCLVIESRDHVAGNAYTINTEGIIVHRYGPHIFHTNDDDIWKFVNRFSDFYPYIHSPKACVEGKIYSLPFNMHTFYEIWGCRYPSEAENLIKKQKYNGSISNLEEQALSLVGHDIYNLLIKGYTQKQWGKDPKHLPAEIIKRLPLRYTFDNNYFNDRYQGIPIEGYTKLIERMLEGCEYKLNIDYFEQKEYWDSLADRVVYTGKIDQFYDYCYGELEYRSLQFITEHLEIENYQGVSQMNYPGLEVPWTRIVEHKHFLNQKTSNTIITKEISVAGTKTSIPYYPVNDYYNKKTYNKYQSLADNETKHIFGGRLAEFRYYDMHQVIASAMTTFKKLHHDNY
jgi:UDP-galactopyranose mutase